MLALSAGGVAWMAVTSDAGGVAAVMEVEVSCGIWGAEESLALLMKDGSCAKTLDQRGIRTALSSR
jgi:hypothetical protein